ncbi:hypothetical protein BC834DRAFT_1041554 [Gloeopeniophorella convolvens]|nr:hypothetical protein BC834DRAFT_1041554 [Gloeopeniophorella convolvens]
MTSWLGELSVPQKILRAARRALAIESLGWRLIDSDSSDHDSDSSDIVSTIPARFPLPKSLQRKRFDEKAISELELESDKDAVFPFRFTDLPVEVLERIFLCYAEPRPNNSAAYRKSSPEWLPITHVCRTWRAVAHNCPTLWSSIPPNVSVFWADVMQQRSKPAPMDVHLRVGRSDIDDREVWMSVHDAVVILQFVFTRLRTLRLDGPREAIQRVLEALRIPAKSLHSLFINVPQWDRPHQSHFSIPNAFAYQAPIHSLSFTSLHSLRAPDWLLRNLTSFTTDGNFALIELLNALRRMTALKRFTLHHCHAIWSEENLSDYPLVALDQLETFTVQAGLTARHFVHLLKRLKLPDTTSRRLSVHTVYVPGWGFWTEQFVALPHLAATDGGLRHVQIKGGPTEGRFSAWTDGAQPERARFCFELSWSGSPRGSGPVRAFDLMSPFYHMHTLCDELGTREVTRLVVIGDPGHVAVSEWYWRQVLLWLPAIEELWLYAGTADVLRSACLAQEDVPPILQRLERVYVVGGVVSTPRPEAVVDHSPGSSAPPSAQVETPPPDENPSTERSSTGPPRIGPPSEESPSSEKHSTDLPSISEKLPLDPPSTEPLVTQDSQPLADSSAEKEENARAHSLNMTSSLTALLLDSRVQLKEVHLQYCTVEEGVLESLHALAEMRESCEVLMDV